MTQKMNQNNNLSVLPFYGSLDEQNHRRSYAYGETYPLYVPLGAVPVFQIIRRHTGASVSGVVMYAFDGTQVGDIRSALVAAGLTVQQYEDDGYDIVIYGNITQQNITTAEGRYYLKVTMSDGDVYYSDVFTVTALTDGMLSIVWFDIQDLVMDGCRIAYTNEYGAIIYRNVLWLNTQLGKPDYVFSEEGENRDGYFFAEKMISEKTYRCNILASEYLCDVMRFIRLSDVVRIVDGFGNTYRADTFLITPKWQDQGDLASVDIEFTCDTVAKKIAHGFVIGEGGDYNDDYNDDYDISNE